MGRARRIWVVRDGFGSRATGEDTDLCAPWRTDAASAFAFCFVQAFRGKLHWITVPPFAINLVANLIFTPIQFGLRNLPLASLDILIVWGSMIWLAIAIWPRRRWVAFAQVPYFVWVSIATALQLSISAMNWGR
ncbi:MAG: tryptophan-rich sensory protein [Phycisphaerales bacterium]|nr:tryptophan-rich sensory protein [Phycisphaerales bacterium]